MRTPDKIYGPEVYYKLFGTYDGYTGSKDQLLVLDAADKKISDYDDLFALQWKRMGEATKVWREANPGNELVRPDLGDLLTWLLEEIEKLKGSIAETSNFSKSAFTFSREKEKFVDKLSSLIEMSEDFNSIGWDEYDESLEIYECTPNLRLSEEAQKYIFDAGFNVVFVNHTDGWITFYRKHKFPNSNPWRRKEKPGGGFEVNYVPSGWGQLGDDALESGYIKVVEMDGN